MKSSETQNLRLMIVAHFLWLLIVCFLGAWWGRLLINQARKIAELESALGTATQIAQNHWHRTERMLYWESITFFGLLIVATGFLFWLYWRDLKRAQGIRAFFASVTHELRTPLTSIRLQAESISENLSTDSSQKPLLNRLFEDTVRLEAQVERTLELARVEGGGPVYSQSLPIKPWLDRFVQSCLFDYSDRVEIQFKVDDVLIEADPAALQVIFKNLIENSIRHFKKTKTAFVNNEDEKVKIQINSNIHDQWIVLQIQDNGDGASHSNKNFGKLFQKGPASQGTGVGLYLVKVLMKRMRGWVEFSVENGFRVSLGFLEGRPCD